MGNLVIPDFKLLISMMGTLLYPAANLFPIVLQRSSFLSCLMNLLQLLVAFMVRKFFLMSILDLSTMTKTHNFLPYPRENDRHN